MAFITSLYQAKKSQFIFSVSNSIYNTFQKASLPRCDFLPFGKYFRCTRMIIASFSLRSRRLSRTVQTVPQDNEDALIKLSVGSMQYM